MKTVKNVTIARVYLLPGEESITAVFVVSWYHLKFVRNIELSRPNFLFSLCFKYNKGCAIWLRRHGSCMQPMSGEACKSRGR